MQAGSQASRWRHGRQAGRRPGRPAGELSGHHTLRAGLRVMMGSRQMPGLASHLSSSCEPRAGHVAWNVLSAALVTTTQSHDPGRDCRQAGRQAYNAGRPRRTVWLRRALELTAPPACPAGVWQQPGGRDPPQRHPGGGRRAAEHQDQPLRLPGQAGGGLSSWGASLAPADLLNKWALGGGGDCACQAQRSGDVQGSWAAAPGHLHRSVGVGPHCVGCCGCRLRCSSRDVQCVLGSCTIFRGLRCLLAETWVARWLLCGSKGAHTHCEYCSTQ
jgi:hypothetical protein